MPKLPIGPEAGIVDTPVDMNFGGLSSDTADYIRERANVISRACFLSQDHMRVAELEKLVNALTVENVSLKQVEIDQLRHERDLSPLQRLMQ
jgi:hypothetical protein